MCTKAACHQSSSAPQTSHFYQSCTHSHTWRNLAIMMTYIYTYSKGITVEMESLHSFHIFLHGMGLRLGSQWHFHFPLFLHFFEGWSICQTIIKSFYFSENFFFLLVHILGDCRTLWGEHEWIQVQNMEQLHALDSQQSITDHRLQTMTQ